MVLVWITRRCHSFPPRFISMTTAIISTEISKDKNTEDQKGEVSDHFFESLSMSIFRLESERCDEAVNDNATHNLTAPRSMGFPAKLFGTSPAASSKLLRLEEIRKRRKGKAEKCAKSLDSQILKVFLGQNFREVLVALLSRSVAWHWASQPHLLCW